MSNKTIYVVTVMKGNPSVVDGIPNGACAAFTFPDEAADYASELNAITDHNEGSGAYFFSLVPLELDSTELLDKLFDYYTDEEDAE